MSQRDEQLRKSLLTNAHLFGKTKTGRFVGGSKLAIAARDRRNDACTSELQATELIGDLIRLGLLEEKEREPGDRIGEIELRHRSFRLTDKGFKLEMGEIDPIVGVADRRSE